MRQMADKWIMRGWRADMRERLCRGERMEITVGFEWSFIENSAEIGSPGINENCKRCGFKFQICQHINHNRCNYGMNGYFDIKVCRCIEGELP
jgi:hypothetical protein